MLWMVFSDPGVPHARERYELAEANANTSGWQSVPRRISKMKSNASGGRTRQSCPQTSSCGYGFLFGSPVRDTIGWSAVCCTAGARRRRRWRLRAAGPCLTGGRPWGVGRAGRIRRVLFGLWKVRIKRSNVAVEAERRRRAAPPLFKRCGHVKAEASSFASAAAGSLRCGASPEGSQAAI